MIRIVEQIDLQDAYTHLLRPDAGGIDLFIGTVRNEAHGKKVLKLVFEAYESMALSEMRRIADKAFDQWPLHALVIQHVLGERQVGEPVVLIGAAAAHRDAAFAACRFLIDSLKQTVPIWKKEYYMDSSIWVAAHP